MDGEEGGLESFDSREETPATRNDGGGLVDEKETLLEVLIGEYGRVLPQADNLGQKVQSKATKGVQSPQESEPVPAVLHGRGD